MTLASVLFATGVEEEATSDAVEIEVPGPPVRAMVTVGQISAYMRRTGWTICANYGETVAWTRCGRVLHAHLKYVSFLSEMVVDLAATEGRPPHLVLADIVAEVADGG